MRYSESEIVEDVLEHIRKSGGEFGEWRMGTARDTDAPTYRQHVNDGLISRAAYTHYAAEEVVDRLKDFGMCPESKSPPAAGESRYCAVSFAASFHARPTYKEDES